MILYHLNIRYVHMLPIKSYVHTVYCTCMCCVCVWRIFRCVKCLLHVHMYVHLLQQYFSNGRLGSYYEPSDYCPVMDVSCNQIPTLHPRMPVDIRTQLVVDTCTSVVWAHNCHAHSKSERILLHTYTIFLKRL